MIPYFAVQAAPYVIFFPNSHKYARGEGGGRRVDGESRGCAR